MNPKVSRIMPAGEYFIGDPCYVFNNESWDRLIKETEAFENIPEGTPYFANETAYGDGSYPGRGELAGFSFPVDAGLIGVTSTSIIDYPIEKIQHLGKVVTFKKDFRIDIDKGILLIEGGYEIDTLDDDEEDADYDYDIDYDTSEYSFEGY